jgi:hypothetical protein
MAPPIIHRLHSATKKIHTIVHSTRVLLRVDFFFESNVEFYLDAFRVVQHT